MTMPHKFSFSHSDDQTVLAFSGSYIMGILPRERSIKQPIVGTVTCVRHRADEEQAGSKRDNVGRISTERIEELATKLSALLTYGEYRLLEHFVGHGLILISHEWYDELTRYSFTIKAAKPAALGDLATPVVSSTLCYDQQELPPRQDAVTLPVAGSGRFVWFTGAADKLSPMPDFTVAQIFLPADPKGAKLLWQPEPMEPGLVPDGMGG